VKGDEIIILNPARPKGFLDVYNLIVSEAKMKNWDNADKTKQWVLYRLNSFVSMNASIGKMDFELAESLIDLFEKTIEVHS
jgi:hypothetical protein